MEVYTTKKSNLLPSFIIWSLFYSIPILLILIASKLSLLVLILIVPGLAFVLIFLNWLFTSTRKLTIKVVENSLEVSTGGDTQRAEWNDIKGIRFLSTGGGLTVLVGKYAKYLGFYRVETDKGDVDLPPSLEGLDLLLKKIIRQAELKRFEPTLERSIVGGFHIFQRGWGNYPVWKKEKEHSPTEVDLNVVVGGLSKSAIHLFIVLLVATILLFLALRYINDKEIFSNG